jgi:enterochelin esterase-like enzyme
VPRPRRWFPLLMLLALAGCALLGRWSGPLKVTPTSPAPAATPLPSATPAVLPTRTPVPSATPLPTPTPSPTLTATATQTPTPTPCGEAAGRVITGTFPSPIQGGEQRYRIYLPPCYGASGRLYPTLYVFHGNIYTESHWDDLGVDGAADAGIAAGTLPPFLIVMPFDGEIANVTSGGDWSFEGVVLHELMPFIEDHYCAWPAREGRALGGISRGGYWSLEIAFRHPDLFAAVGGHSAALFYEYDGPGYNPLTAGLDPQLNELAIYLDIGDQDWLRQGVFDLHAAMDAAGIGHEWWLNPGAHTDAYWAEHIPEYLAWYASHWPAGEGAYPAADGACRP